MSRESSRVRLPSFLLTLWSLAFCANAWSIAVSPAPSINGNYTVSWPSWASTGCTYSYPYPGWPVYNCYYLEEKVGSGYWTGVSTTDGSTSKSFTGRPVGNYSYQIHYYTGDYYSQYDYVIDGPASTDVGIPPMPPYQHPEYGVRSGDLDGDGDVDIYVKRVSGSGWNLPLSEFVLRHNANGTFSVETSISSYSRYLISQWPVSSIVPKLVDFNADGYLDVLLSGLPPANAGASDLVVFASYGPGAPPLTARLLDDGVRSFVLDIVSSLSDPHYYDNAFEFRCDTTYYWYPTDYWDIDGTYHYSSLPLPFSTCSLQVVPPFSVAALNIASSLLRVRDAGKLTVNETDAGNIASQFQQVFGVPFMGGVLQGASLVADDYAHPLESLDTFRMLRFASTLSDLYKYFRGIQTPNEHHQYTVHTQICAVGTTGCTLANVYHRMLQFPVPGRAEGACGVDHPISECSQEVPDNGLVHVQFDDGFGIGDGGDVIVTRQANYCFTNTTQPGHVFYPGTVQRCASVQNGYIVIDTNGQGDGQYKDLNQGIGPTVFKPIDITIMSRIAQEAYGIILPP